METRQIAVFDFDGTITRGDTFLPLLRFAFGDVKLLCGLLCNLPWLAAYKCGLYPNGKAKQRLFGWFFAGMTLRRFDEVCTRFFAVRGAGMIRPDTRARIADCLRRRAEVLIVSASADNWVRPFARHLGIAEVVGTQAEVSAEGVLTGRFATPNCYGPEKVARLAARIPDRTHCRIEAYGDSRGDRELLAFADEPHYKLFKD